MRLTCPNCGAQYEVPDDVIPQAGRDVQCSNCGDTWFQAHPDAEAPVEEDAFSLPEDKTESDATEPAVSDDHDEFEEVEPPEISLGEDTPVDETFFDTPKGDQPPEDSFGEEDTPEAEPESNWGVDPDETSDDEPDEAEVDDSDLDLDDLVADTPDTVIAADDDATQPDDDSDYFHDYDKEFGDEEDGVAEDEPFETHPPARERQELDASVADVLRQEAEHEARARSADALETQPDLGLRAPENETDKRLKQAKARMRRLRGMPDDPEAQEPTEPPKPDSRRDLLPDIEDINATLRGSGDTLRQSDGETGETSETKRRRGFRLGFGIALLLALAAIVTYSSSQQIAEAYPAAAPFVNSFIESANNGRVWLDTQVTNLFLWLDGIASGE
ncbi:zinc-ribbon domain-containing protein [Shimia abyssi]|uniref:Putative Zn finger-like uncharacterized protein n=1 Tax=Shimia abyssi TaxID=1662395 RepID=A0A2P8FEQ2_9RHOB|nr:zinc-ribbon domain-containing protein [Shimia abyssi]PSL20197.1 putative Zn finger-like uncharacterized protein [Shimia abyssi]